MTTPLLTRVSVVVQVSCVSHFVPRTVAALYWPRVRNDPLPSPHSLRDFFFLAAAAALLPRGHESASVSASVVTGLEPLVCVSLNSPSKKSALAVLPLPCAAVIVIRPARVSIVVPTGICAPAVSVTKRFDPGRLTVHLAGHGCHVHRLARDRSGQRRGGRRGRGARPGGRGIEQDGERVVHVLGDRDVRTRVPVEIGRRDGLRRTGERDRLVTRKAPARVAVQDLHRAAVGADREVRVAVAVEIGGGNPDRHGGDGDRGLGVGAVVGGAPEEHGHGARVRVRHRKVGAAVAVEVAGGDADWVVADGDVRLGREAWGQRDRHVVGADVGRRQVAASVAVEVADRQRPRRRTGREARQLLREPSAHVRQDRDVVAGVEGDREIGAAVAVEVAGRDRRRGLTRARSEIPCPARSRRPADVGAP